MPLALENIVFYAFLVIIGRNIMPYFFQRLIMEMHLFIIKKDSNYASTSVTIKGMRLNKKVIILSALVLLGYLYLFKDIFFQNKVLFPSNFLAEFYSPYRSETFPGWEQGIPHKPIGTDQIRF